MQYFPLKFCISIVFSFLSPSLALDNGVGETPPLAWSSWNFFATGINEEIVLDIGKAMVSTGLAKVGYEYVNIDAGSMQFLRDANGKIQADAKKFPHGMRYIADKLHAMGLKLGVYTDLTDHSCGTGPGSKGHYISDANTFAHDWEVDYLKVDYCGAWDGKDQTPLAKSCSAGSITVGGDIHRAKMTVPAAIDWCIGDAQCEGFTTNSSAAHVCPTSKHYSSTAVFDFYFKDGSTKQNWNNQWSYFSTPGMARVSYQPEPQYKAWKALGDALNATGRPIYYSICPHTPTPTTGTAAEFAGTLSYAPPPSWTAEQRHNLANSILVEYTNTFDEWYAPNAGNDGCKGAGCHGGILTDIDSMVQMTLLNYSVPGSWNDADMLQLCTYGKGATPHSTNGMTLAEYRAHYSVWSVLASPLIISADLRTIAKDHPDCLALMLNPEIVAVNQDPAGLAPFLVSQRTNGTSQTNKQTSASARTDSVIKNGIAHEKNVTTSNIISQVFARALQGGEVAVVLLNRAESAATLTVTWKELGLNAGTTYSVRDVANNKDLPAATDHFEASIGKHDVSFVRLKLK